MSRLGGVANEKKRVVSHRGGVFA